jgi:prepilin-type N-terminal cleavage/methylation domain-containing protein
MTRIRQRLAREEGFTLIELLVVIVIIGILLAIAVPSYLGFKDRAAEKAGQSNIRAAVPSLEAYFADYGVYNNAADPDGAGPLPAGSFTEAFLKTNYDSGLKTTGNHAVTIAAADGPDADALVGDGYTITACGKNGVLWTKAGPGADPTSAASAAC